MIKLINGVERNLGLMDFCVDKLSNRLAVMIFDDFTLGQKKLEILMDNKLRSMSIV